MQHALAQTTPFTAVTTFVSNIGVPAFNFNKNGGFWIFGGSGGGRRSSLWRYNRDSKTFTFIDGSNSTDAAGIQPNKPTPRDSPNSWVDNTGNLYIYGGNGFNRTGTATGNLADFWVYNVSGSGWRYITGSTVPGQVVAGTLEPRADSGRWTDESDKWFYIFSGNNCKL